MTQIQMTTDLDTKVCRKCGAGKPLRGFPRHKRYRDGVYPWCRPCWRAAHNRHQSRYKQSPLGKATVANKRFLKLYGKTRDEISELIRQQGGRCAICDCIPEPKNLHVDHDHRTGQIRGLLCHMCNHALGNLREDPELFARALKYLRS